MKRTQTRSLRLLALLLGLLLCFAGCIQINTPDVPAPKTAPPTERIDLWTAPPKTNTPLPSDSPAAEVTSKPTETPAPTDSPAPTPTEAPVAEDGVYDGKEDVALYLHLYGHLPSNYITKKTAQSLGWPGGYLEPYAPGKCIGGDRFGNYEKLLPSAKGRIYYECDVGTLGKRSRGEKRIIYSSDGLIYYTDDHYNSFTLLYGGN